MTTSVLPDTGSVTNGDGRLLEGPRLLVLALLTTLVLVPVTLPVAVLRGLVLERFAVSELLTSLFMSVNMVGAIVAAPLSGILSDFLGRRKSLVVGALLVDAVLLLLLTADVSFPVFLLIRFLEGAAHILALSLLLALAADHAGAGRRGRVMGAAGAGITLGVALGAPLGGILGATNALVPLRVGAAVSLAASMLVLFTLSDARGDRRSPSLSDIGRAIRKDRWLLVPLLFAFTDRFTVGFFTTTFPLFLQRIHGFEPPRVGLLLATFLLPFAFFSYVAGRASETRSRTAMICIGSLLYGAAVLLIGYLGAGWLTVLMPVLGILSAVMFVPSLVLTTELAGPGIRATAMGAFNAAGSLGFILGPLVGGTVSQVIASASNWATGYQMAFVVAGMSEITCVMVAFPLLLRLRREGRIS